MAFRLKVLGGFELVGPDGALELGSKKAMALVAYLACTTQPQSRGVLATMLWGSHFDVQARQNLRQALTRLRRLLGEDVIVAEGEMVALKDGAVTTDFAAFEALALLPEHDSKARAIELYQGPFCAGLVIPQKGWSEWTEGRRRRCEQLAVDCLLHLANNDLLQGRAEQALANASRAIAVDRLREDCHRLIMTALAALQRRTEAVQHYRHFAECLQRELGVEPEPATASLANQISGGIGRPPAAAVPASSTILPGDTKVVEPGSPVADASSRRGMLATSLALLDGTSRAITRISLLLLFTLLAALLAAYRAPLLSLWSDEQRRLSGSQGIEASSSSTATPPMRVIKHCASCPEMVVLPPGEFLMGSPPTEVGRYEIEGPQRRIVLARSFAIGRFHITTGQFEAFVKETGHPVTNGCRFFDAVQNRHIASDGSFRSPGYKPHDAKPVVCVSWTEAKSYTEWLAQKTGMPYRLPSEAEFEYAARAGTTTLYSWGDDPERACEFARFSDRASSLMDASTCFSSILEYGPAPVGSLKPNPWGIYDIPGNAWSFVEDCWVAHYRFHPADGSPLTLASNCMKGVFRGGGWHSKARYLRPSGRLALDVNWRANTHGFRVALTLDD